MRGGYACHRKSVFGLYAPPCTDATGRAAQPTPAAWPGADPGPIAAMLTAGRRGPGTALVNNVTGGPGAP